MMTMVARKVVVFRCGMLVFAIECLSCFSATSSAGTTAAQWTLYSGLKLSWNEASMFCKSLGGHLPVINTKLKWNAFNATVVNWQKANLSVGRCVDWSVLTKSLPCAQFLGGRLLATAGRTELLGTLGTGQPTYRTSV
ncbi:uncharacterized protein LOC112558816 [Pomacea canaliculata]|uniref:uncharacterized protein LOC112558816 n=1 Tax=Pomacea canaliculata TaxID=400727 RepID=UPI000D72924F|nr:uncharacterized protein LOC112558816 [Pomacea canaliculata]